MSPIPADVPQENIQLEIDQPHMEIMGTDEGKVWQVMGGVTQADYDALETEPPYIKVGIGKAAMDAGYFKRSPGAKVDGPMETRELFGHNWGYCARPASAPALPTGPDGPRQILVDKHHVAIYSAGRDLDYLVLPDGSEHVQVIVGEASLVLPEGWQIRRERLEQERTIELPAPTTVFFFPNGDSFQGPI